MPKYRFVFYNGNSEKPEKNLFVAMRYLLTWYTVPPKETLHEPTEAGIMDTAFFVFNLNILCH